MAGFGSVDNPFYEAFGPIVEVHWPKKDTPCEGSSTSSGEWGTLEDNTFVNTTTVGEGGGPIYLRMEANGFWLGAVSGACSAEYTISTTVTIAGTTDTEDYTDSGLLLPGQSFIVGMVRQGWLDFYLTGPFALPSFDRRFLYGFGDYRLIEMTITASKFDP